jgi:glycosyltransferase involved in cell wall biosynthesis
MDPQPELSVVICTHNPRRAYLEKTLAHLRRQTLPVDDWELLIVDNRSDESIREWCDVSWHPRGRIVPEESLGLTNARMCGIEQTGGEVIVLVDDDNLLAADYLAEARAIGRRCPFLGAWGGQQKPLFEQEPPARLKELYSELLAIRDIDRPVWSNIMGTMEATPHGAGMCIRRHVAKRYVDLLRNDPLRRSLDRAGAALTGSGDHDMAFVACDEGLGVGLFPSLVLEHLMPPERFDEGYLLRLTEGGHFSAAILGYCRSGRLPSLPRMTPLRWAWLRLRCFGHSPERWRKLVASVRGTARAAAFLAERQPQESPFRGDQA